MERELAAVGLRPGDLGGRVAVVTGAARGIGRAAALALSHLGAKVAVLDVSAEGEETAAQICRTGGAARFYPVDVSDGDAVERFARQVEAEMGRPDILINNAALCPVATVEQMHPALWDRVLAVNLRGPFLLTRAFLPALRAAGRGVLVNMVSADAMPGLSAYIAAKQGLAGFTQSLAVEVGEDGLRVVALAPGMVETPGLLEAAGGLAPLLGMRADEFRRVSLHPAYAGLMPVEHAGLAVAILVARLAGEYHGQVVSGYEVLERAGVIGPAAAPLAAAPASAGQAEAPVRAAAGSAGQAEAPDRTATGSAGQADVPGRTATGSMGIAGAPARTATGSMGTAGAPARIAGGTPASGQARLPGAKETGAPAAAGGGTALVDQLDRLLALLAETDADFRRLPLFVRPLARSGFRAKAGRSLEAWRQQADQARECAASGRPFDWAGLRADLGRLLAYVRGVPAETARFTRDPAVLGEVQRRTEANAAALEALMAVLQNM